MIVRYEAEVRDVLDMERAAVVRTMRTEAAETWRGVGAACIDLWDLKFGQGDTQSSGQQFATWPRSCWAKTPTANPGTNATLELAPGWAFE